MHNDLIHVTPEVASAFAEYDRKATFSNLKLACVLGMVLMPLGVVLDVFVYPWQADFFLLLRLACSLLIGLFLSVVVLTRFGQVHCRAFGIFLSTLPSFSMAWMIYIEDGALSPYYAGMNLVLLIVGFILHWTFMESLTAVSMVMAMYISACFLQGRIQDVGIFGNNLYFLILAGLVVVTGSHFHSKLRLREFALRYELDRNRRELEDTNQKLTELDQAKSRFFANISHELRTPLTLLLAPLESLQARFNSVVDTETRDLLATMHSNGMRLLKLINDLLDLVRMESGRLQTKSEPVNIAEFIQGLASAVRPMASDKRLRMETTVDESVGTVMTDRDKLEKVVLNLVFNSLKFTPAGGRVEIRVRKEAEQLLLQVEDTGMGIAPQNLAHVFDRFWQADDSARRKYQGVGIGLALVKELVELQKGSVAVESREGKGTTFTIRLPYMVAEEPKAKMSDTEKIFRSIANNAQAPVTVASDEWLSNLYRRAELFPALTPVAASVRQVEIAARNKNLFQVLIADDEPEMLRFLESQLGRHYHVLEAVDGQQAIEKASQFLPDVIVLDMMMPEKDGLQACRELRSRTPTQGIPIIMLTARADEETKMAALQAGANDFLTKPFSTTELHVRIKNLINSYHYQREVSKKNQALEETIEQLKETESQLVQTEKLASLGRMSAGIIHEINNPLNFATTGLFTLKKKASYIAPEQQAEYAEILKDVEDGIIRVKTIVSDLRSFSHHENETLEQVEVSEVLSSALRFLSHEWKNKVSIEQRLAENQAIWVNKNKLIQVFVNLLQNSLDALRHKKFEDDKPSIRITGEVAAGRSVITIRDNGEGIPAEALDKIFDPFFTTKDVGQGMGLGLSICYRIVQSYDGSIRVRSEQGKFCEFALEFPVKGMQPVLAEI